MNGEIAFINHLNVIKFIRKITKIIILTICKYIYLLLNYEIELYIIKEINILSTNWYNIKQIEE